MISTAESQLSQSSPLGDRHLVLGVRRDSILRLMKLKRLPDVLQYHLVGIDGLGGEDALALVRFIATFRRKRQKQSRQKSADLTAVVKRAEGFRET